MSKDCIEWQGSVSKRGYGRLTVWDKALKKVRYISAHRQEWENHFGPIPDGLHVLHACDNPRCINIDHLSLGTPLENARQKVERGRLRVQRGSTHGLAKLTESQVVEIKAAIANGEPLSRIAARYPVGVTAIRAIKTGNTWRHVS